MKLTEEEFVSLRDDNCGLCENCGEINDSFHEPDAENYQCENCGENKSHGIENCLIMGLLDITD